MLIEILKSMKNPQMQQSLYSTDYPGIDDRPNHDIDKWLRFTASGQLLPRRPEKSFHKFSLL